MGDFEAIGKEKNLTVRSFRGSAREVTIETTAEDRKDFSGISFAPPPCAGETKNLTLPLFSNLATKPHPNQRPPARRRRHQEDLNRGLGLREARGRRRGLGPLRRHARRRRRRRRQLCRRHRRAWRGGPLSPGGHFPRPRGVNPPPPPLPPRRRPAASRPALQACIPRRPTQPRCAQRPA